MAEYRERETKVLEGMTNITNWSERIVNLCMLALTKEIKQTLRFAEAVSISAPPNVSF